MLNKEANYRKRTWHSVYNTLKQPTVPHTVYEYVHMEKDKDLMGRVNPRFRIVASSGDTEKD